MSKSTTSNTADDREWQEFLAGEDTLRVCHAERLVFVSQKDRLLPLMEYLERFPHRYEQVIIWDKIAGNAAALLAVKASAGELHSPLGSELAAKTLQKSSIRYHFLLTVPHIERADGQGMCPMEQLSLGKEPEEFYQVMLKLIRPEKKEK